jgi:hypothetical protein
VAFLDADCTPVPTWAEGIVSRLNQAGERLAAVQGPVGTDRTLQGIAFAITSFGQLQGRTARPIHMLTGNNCAFRRDEFLREPFDETPQFHGPEVKKISKFLATGREVILEPLAAVDHAFEPGLRNFATFATYWGWCFLQLRRDAGAHIPYARLFNGMSWLAPVALVPAKSFMDARRTLQNRRAMQLSWAQVLFCIGFLCCMSFAVGYGGMLARLGKAPPRPVY